MQLKKLEIHGFKSFAEKTKFSFSEGITVVVGPNGSGKSNIADAIRWVLGEQSIKSLRGGKTEDIIFAGTSNRKPLGMAEVSLVLDNQSGLFPIDFSDVKVTRRVYRSGESEYFINDAPCRLKDILELFADSGLGKDTLAIVGQGKIDEILSVRSEDRRGIIEEAAGIIRYRNRKKEAERKLLNTERDLERIDDILDTLGERIEPLSDQKAKAEVYIELNTELKDLEFQLLMQVLDETEVKRKSLEERIELQKKELQNKETVLHSLEAELETKKLELLKDEESISNLQQQLLEVTSEWEKNHGDIKLISEKQLFVQEKLLDNDLKYAQLQNRLEAIDNNRQQSQITLKEKNDNYNQLLHTLEAFESSKNDKLERIRQLEAELESKKLAAFDTAQELSQAKNTLQNITKNKELGTHKLNSVREKILKTKEELDSSQQALNLQNLSFQEANEAYNNLAAEENQSKQSLQQLQQRQNQVAANILEKNSSADSARKQHAFYVEMENKHEGYGQAIRTLFDAKQKGHQSLKNLVGTVADIINVASKYEVAIETALGAALQNIITLDENDAAKAINFLKKNSAGRATFLPMSVIRGEKLNNSKYLIASDVIEIDAKFTNVVNHLLGRTIIAEDMDSALSAAKDTAHRYRIVTLEGDVIFPGGSMAGGSAPKRQTNFLARKRIIEELAAKAESLRQEVLKLRDDAEQNLVEIKSTEKFLQDINTSKQTLVEKIRVADREIALKKQQLKNIEIELLALLEEEKVLQSQEMVSAEELLEAELTVKKGETAYHQITLEIENLTKQFQKSRTENDQDNDDFIELKTTLTRLEEEIKNKKLELQLLNKDHNETKLNLDKLVEEKTGLTFELQEFSVQYDTLNASQKECSERRTKLENQVQIAKEQKQQKHMLCFEDEQKVKILQKQLSALSEEIHSQQVRLAKVETENEAYQQKLLEDFNTAERPALEDFKATFNKKTVQERIKYLQGEIAKLGSVNLTAIEEYQEVTERFNFLSEQKTDLSAAKDSLFKVIEEIEREMCSKFMETFNAVNNEFQKVFHQVFGGGSAKLTLTNEENLLESGIEIIAQPPGKKLQHLMLLSGGERALTAIALLFAILRIKPAPFCVLDEIEAALDEANVERFASFLKDYSSKTSFIVISHRQGTMEVADTLYGVTMEESGVTKLISVKFDDRIAG